MKARIAQFVREERLQLLLIALPIIASLAAMPFATDRVPMQWGMRGQVNWYAPKEWGLLVMPAALVMTFSLVFWLESLDPARHREADGTLSSHGRATRLIRLAISAVLGAVSIIQISAALGHHPNVTRIIPSLVALLLAFLGNSFGKLKPNRYVGIRVPWTMNSETVWRHTHRISGWLYTSSSLLMLMAIWLLPVSAHPACYAVWLTVIVVAPLFIAWQAAQREKLQKGLSK